MTAMKALVWEIGGTEPILHPTDKELIVFTNQVDHFVCETPTGHESFKTQPVIREASEDEIAYHRRMVMKNATISPVMSGKHY
jgi:hypothetical protein